MKIGTKSLLFGCHQFILHPIFVFWAWKKLYGWPTLKQCVMFMVHDWGYWGCPNMDSIEGEDHPLLGWLILRGLGFREESMESLCHSRFFAKSISVKPSRLCWADKLGNALMPIWLYSRVGGWTGEIEEYKNAVKHEGVKTAVSNREFFLRYRGVIKWLFMVQDIGPCVEYAELKWKLEHIPYEYKEEEPCKEDA